VIDDVIGGFVATVIGGSVPSITLKDKKKLIRINNRAINLPLAKLVVYTPVWLPEAQQGSFVGFLLPP